MYLFRNIDTEAGRLLHPQPVLPKFLFDDKQIINEEIRQHILRQAEFIINQTVAKFPGLVIEDVVLAGSLASYLYHEKSDYDISIIVKNKNCCFISDTPNNLLLFLISLFSNFSGTGYYFSYKERHIDFNIFDESKILLPNIPNRLLGLYSLKRNCWINRPAHVIDPKITVGDLVFGYFETLENLYLFLGKLPLSGNAYSSENLQKMYDYYYSLKTDFTYSSNKNYLISKLLSSQGVLHELGENIMNGYRASIIDGTFS